MWDRDRKIARVNSSRKIKSTGFNYLLGSKIGEAEGHLTMWSCLQDVVISSAPRIGKYINKLEFYRQFPPRTVKDSKIYEIENNSCMRSVMKVNPVSRI